MSETTPAAPMIVSVNVGRPKAVAQAGRTVVTAIWKRPVEGRVAARGVNLDGDQQADRQVHGGPDKAVYAYAGEDTGWWEAELGRPLGPGAFGENLTTAGLDVTGAVIGERWAIGTAVFEVCQPRTPCGKLGLRMGDVRFPRRFAHALRPGAYLRIVTEGHVGAGDPIEVVSRPAHGVTVGLVAEADLDPTLAPRLVAATELAEGWLAWAREQDAAVRAGEGR
ncbi:MAG: MOSC domain-containing protein [Acidimicrobiales bacterium]